jgi:uncharacterized membrane protein (DUF485 family)
VGRIAVTRPSDRNETGDREEPSGKTPASRLGLALFAIYLAFYLGFVLISAFACDWFEIILPGGLNLAVVYGFGLIILALVLAMIYGGVKQQERL